MASDDKIRGRGGLPSSPEARKNNKKAEGGTLQDPPQMPINARARPGTQGLCPGWGAWIQAGRWPGGFCNAEISREGPTSCPPKQCRAPKSRGVREAAAPRGGQEGSAARCRARPGAQHGEEWPPQRRARRSGPRPRPRRPHRVAPIVRPPVRKVRLAGPGSPPGECKGAGHDDPGGAEAQC